MTMGIYVLKFKGTDKVYIGQSVNIENRWIAHKKYMHAGKSNYKVQEAYKSYGMPTMEIVCTTEIKEELNSLEVEAFEIFNCIENGLNIASEPDIHSEGELNGASKYSNAKVLAVFEMLLNEFNSYKYVSECTDVNISTVRHIANGESHSWLQREYPDKYAILVSLKGLARASASNSAKARGIVYPTILSPEGVEYTVEICSVFAKEHGLDPSSLAKVLKRTPKYKSHKGWTLK